MRAAIYARFSSDKQSDTSTEDQARLCRERAAALELDVVVVHFDQAISGATPVERRPGGRALMADAQAGRFDVLLFESLDRLSRDHVEQETIVRRLEHRAIRIIGVSDGYDSASGVGRKLLRGVRGLIAETYLDDLRAKTHRGLTGQIERGYHAGGLSFGYRSTVAGLNARGESIGHRLEVEPGQAAIVREILARYAVGESCQRIAAQLNARGVRGPRGGTWCVSAIYGSPAKGAGILNNELYIGRYVWNRSRWIKDPDTGRRQRFQRPPSEWQIDERPELRIVDDDAWRAVRGRMDATRGEGGRAGRGGVPTTLFGGILRCGCCGGAVVAVSGRNYGCAARKDRGATVCGGVLARRDDVDRVLLEHVAAALSAPETLEWIETEALSRNADQARDGMNTKVREATLVREIERLADAVAQMGISPALSERLRKAEAELEALKRARTRAEVTTLPSAIRLQVRAMVADLAAALNEETTRARDALRAMLGELRLVQENDATYAECDDAAERLLLAVGGASLDRVAGVGFEPTTFGL